MKELNLNGTIYMIHPMTFNDVCELEDIGLSMDQIGEKAFGTMRAFVAVWTHKSVAEAGEEIEKHIESGGSFDDITDAVSTAVEESGFFKSLGNTRPRDHEKKRTKPSENNA